MARRAPFRILDTEVRPGQRATVDVPLAQLYTHTQLHMPVQVVHGRREGPVLLVSAALHGDEINGVEIIRRLLKLSALRQLAGTLVAVPIVNVFGFIHRSRYLPDRRDLNRCFPGSERGSLGARTAYLFRTGIVERCNHVIDLHTAAIHRDNLPQIRVNLENAEAAAMARAFGMPLTLNSGLIEGSLRAVADDAGIPVITYEAGEALRFQEPAIKAGLAGTVRVMRSLGMLPSRSGRHTGGSRQSYVANASQWVRAEQDGIFRTVSPLGTHVKQRQVLGYIADPFGERELPVHAPFSGIVVGRNNLPLVNEGEALYHVARYDQAARAERVAAQWAAFEEGLNGDYPPSEEPPIV
ncbi:succinylglutamate desuccinylase/aspartoacylase family protein [Alkalilimnicola ehrlichii MLHE-1]|uniref:Succinylglutamate desuccinylase/aspartoacylase n=1 Tax=Alkalilimnicola ehrlichii (strain ATCC BAA-1101 / DSM 17681 / MLHE-1) TaxID=187272 RepID=Q0AC78_ALKEH|nr:succinylglutamate desuccinylase/aspartoacylase family protein [Alkalilimnicola ehrlichii]ABI55559.1 Succinylglutamate desuccinylase/aspartoacylase [Alkalilimnicola ehrlichii MLHE-1]